MAEEEVSHSGTHSPQTVTIPGIKKKIPKNYAYAGAGIVAVLAVVWYRGRHSSGTPADPAADPAATAADTSGEAFGGGTGGDFGPGLQGGGGIIGYDSNGNPIYGNTTGNQVATGPPFVSNAAWSQYAEATLTTVDPAALTNALGAYIAGDPVTPAQRVLINDAISVAGKPPEVGKNGFPPSINVSGSSAGGGTVVVPRLVGSPLGNARDTLKAEGLKVRTTPAQKPGTSYKVTRQTPLNGKRVAAGSTVSLTIVADGHDAPKESRVPNVVGERVDDARAELEKAGFGKVELSQARKRNTAYTVHAQNPEAGKMASHSVTVRLTIRPVTSH